MSHECILKVNMKPLIFLGGTVGRNSWRDDVIKALVSGGVRPQSIFNPVVNDWNEDARVREEKAKAEASVLLFMVTNPKEDGNPRSAYSMVEATMALYDDSERTVVVFDSSGMSGHPLKDINQTTRILKKRFPNANIFDSLQEAIDWLISHFVQRTGL